MIKDRQIQYKPKIVLPRRIDFSIVIFFVFYIMMMRGSDLKIENYTTFILMLLWVFITFIFDTNLFIKACSDKTVVLVIIYLVYIFVLSIISSFDVIGSIGNIINQMTLFIGIFMFNYYKYKYDVKRFNRVLCSVLFIWMYYCIKALIFYYKNPGAARMIVSGEGVIYGNVGIGKAYGMAFGSAIIAVFLFGWLLTRYNKKNYKMKILVIFTILIFCYLCINTESTITTISLFTGILFQIVLYILKNDKSNIKIRKLLGVIILCVVTVFVLLNLKNIGAFLMNVTSGSNSILAVRVSEIGGKLLYGTSNTGDGGLYLREIAWQKSFNAFVDYPIFGEMVNSGLQITPDIGNHSEILDILGSVGIVGGIPYLLIFFNSIKKERKQSHQFKNWTYIISFLIMIIFNPFHYQQSNFTLFFIIPSLSLVATRLRSEVLFS